MKASIYLLKYKKENEMKKQFTTQNFKSSAKKTGDYLNNKGYNIPRSTILNSLSLFLGYKNWNTLESILKNNTDSENSLFNRDSSIYIISADNQESIDSYISNTVIPYILNNFNEKKIIQRGINSIEKYKNYNSNFILFDKNHHLNNNSLFIKHCMRLDPDYIIVNDINNYAESIVMAAITGHIVIIGIVSDSYEDIVDKIFNNLFSQDQKTYQNAILLKESISKIIKL